MYSLETRTVFNMSKLSKCESTSNVKTEQFYGKYKSTIIVSIPSILLFSELFLDILVSNENATPTKMTITF